MASDSVNVERLKKLSDLKIFLNKIDDNLKSLIKDLNWDYQKLENEIPLNMVTCTINNQHRVPSSKLKSHEEKCSWHHEGYKDDDKPFSDHSDSGSFVTLTPQLIKSITDNIPSSTERKAFRCVPQTSANFDQNFNREEKLAIYDFVIANTKKEEKSFSELFVQPFEKKEEKKEMTAWEIAAAERDAKRRRASYRNKVHTNCKTHTEILREVIESQMETFKEVNRTELEQSKNDRNKYDKKPEHKSRHSKEEKKWSSRDSSRRKDEEFRKRKYNDRHSNNKDGFFERSPSAIRSDSDSRSRFHHKYRKWKSDERSHSHKSSHSHRRS